MIKHFEDDFIQPIVGESIRREQRREVQMLQARARDLSRLLTMNALQRLNNGQPVEIKIEDLAPPQEDIDLIASLAHQAAGVQATLLLAREAITLLKRMGTESQQKKAREALAAIDAALKPA